MQVALIQLIKASAGFGGVGGLSVANPKIYKPHIK